LRLSRKFDTRREYDAVTVTGQLCNEIAILDAANDGSGPAASDLGRLIRISRQRGDFVPL